MPLIVCLTMAFIRRALGRIGVDKDDHLRSMEEGSSSVLIDHDEGLEGELQTSIIPNLTANSSERVQVEDHTPKVRIVEISSPLVTRVST